MSSIKDLLLSDIKVAMKARDSEKVSVLRFCQSAIKNKEINQRPKPLTDEDTLGVLKQLVKQRKDSIEQFKNAGRMDLSDKESAELAIIEGYLPEQVSEEALVQFVDQAVADLGATSMKDMGAVMKLVLEKAQGNADNRLISQLVKGKLS